MKKTISVVCFEIVPEYRGIGIATAFLERICNDAKIKGYDTVEGYVRMRRDYAYADYCGPGKSYEKVGFKEVERQDNHIVMRKVL